LAWDKLKGLNTVRVTSRRPGEIARRKRKGGGPGSLSKTSPGTRGPAFDKEDMHRAHWMTKWTIYPRVTFSGISGFDTEVKGRHGVVPD
jgi:hypothetical protein